MRKLYALLMVLFTPVGSLLAACTATEKNTDYTVDNGPSNSVSLNANINAVGDLVAFGVWCYPSCTPVSVTLGSQTAVQTTVSGNPGGGSPGTGQGFIFYIPSATFSGSQTATWTVSGTHSGIQFSYLDFSPSAGCHFTHNVDSPLGSGTGDTANTPSITPSAGDLLVNFTWISEHVTSVNSPWSCANFHLPGETQTCFAVNTFNTLAYILSAASGSTANNMTLIHPTDDWQALITSFSMSSSQAQAPQPPTNLQATVQ